MKNTLAENMMRFGVKNLNKQLQKTLLNEGLAPGAGASYGEVVPKKLTDGDYSPELRNKLQPYPAGILEHGALIATAVGTNNLIRKDKKLNKSLSNLSVDTIFNMLTGNTNSSEVDRLIRPLLSTSTDVTYEKTVVSVYPSPENVTRVATMGRMPDNNVKTGVSDSSKQASTGYHTMIKYLNAFNCENVLDGDFTQYRLSNMVDDNKFVNLIQGEKAVNTVIVYTASTKIPDTAGKAINTTKVGAIAPIDKTYDVNFRQGVATVPAADPAVALAIKDAIAMFPDGIISNLSVVSSASPEYGSITNKLGWQKSYPNGVTGNGDPGRGTTDASKNIKLAYDRGVNFVAAINAGLVAQGKPEMSNTSINWQISDKGGSTNSLGRFSQVNWTKVGTPGKNVTQLASTGNVGEKTSGKDTFTVVQHVFTCVS